MDALIADFYQFSMLQAYLVEGMTKTAVFELFVRQLPPGRNFLVAAGLEQALDYLEQLHLDEAEIDWLMRQGGMPVELGPRLRGLRFDGDVDAMPEGSVFFPHEPILRVTAALPVAQWVESRLLNIVHCQTVVASKAARLRQAAGHRRLIDFGMRHAHGAEAALFAARAAWIAGWDGTATAEAARRYAIPVVGTMAHSFIEVHRCEEAAFAAYARTRPDRSTFLVDTYDTEAAVAKLARIAPALRAAGATVGGIWLDSGDLAAHSRTVRRMLDDAGLTEVEIFASGNLDEHRIASLVESGASIDGFGVGTALSTASDAPSLDMVYKLQVYEGVPRRKRSEGKATWPGAKQVSRSLDDAGFMTGDLIHLTTETAPGTPLLQPCMRNGRRVAPSPSLAALRSHHAAQKKSLPRDLARLDGRESFPVHISPELESLTRLVDEWIDGQSWRGPSDGGR